jgi:glycosyltransferase involved in cell wall biosynthesis
MNQQVCLYAEKARKMAQETNFDVIHAHDWMTYPAGIAAARASGKPLVVHVHSTEFDRSGSSINLILIISNGKDAAPANYRRVIIQKHILNRHGIAPEKVEVVYNGVESNPNMQPGHADRPEKTVLLRPDYDAKRPEYFGRAKKDAEAVKFIVPATAT